MNAPTLRRSIAAAVFALLVISGQAVAGDDFWKFPSVWDGPRKPVIDLSYGSGSVRQRLFEGTLADIDKAEIGLGYMRSRTHSEGIADIDEKFLLFDYSSGTLFGRSVPAGNVGATLVRFGTGTRRGYAYDFGTSFLYPYHQTAFLWTKVTTTRPAGLSAHDQDILDRYEGTFRFGERTEGGIAFGMRDLISLHVGYEATVIYPRHVFWPWLGSMIIVGAGIGAISHFGDDIVDGSPTLGPILYALLRSGLAYGYYLTVRDKQYWPFGSETPMTTESLRVGISMTF